MPDRAAFERLLAEELERLAGPRRAVDTRSISEAARNSQPDRAWSVVTRRLRHEPMGEAPKGGIRTMFSAVRVVTVAAVVGLAGGLLITGVLSPPTAEVGAPGAASESIAPASWVRVTGTETCTGTEEATYEPEIGGIEHFRGAVERCVADLSDPRVSGTWTSTGNADSFPVDVGIGSDESDWLIWGTRSFDSADAGWECSFTGTTDPYNPVDGLVLGVCPGTGANEGWTYVYQQTSGDGGGFRDGSTIRGMIYQGDPPPREMAAG